MMPCCQCRREAAPGPPRVDDIAGTSNGCLTAHAGGNRWRWEQRIFGHAYDDTPPAERPRYGALDHRRRGLGGAPRFGSAHQRHGPVTLATDVEALVLDPCYRGSRVEAHAEALTATHGVRVEWHEGRVLTCAELVRHNDFRGSQVGDVGLRIAEDGELDAAVIGRAVAEGVEDPQDLKKVWHLVARFGAPARSGR